MLSYYHMGIEYHVWECVGCEVLLGVWGGGCEVAGPLSQWRFSSIYSKSQLRGSLMITMRCSSSSLNTKVEHKSLLICL